MNDHSQTAAAVRERLELKDDELLELLGTEVSAAAGGLERRTRRLLGESWFSEQRKAFQSSVCSNHLVRQLRRDHADIYTLATAVADVLAATFSVPAAATAALLLVRFGLEKLCNELPGD